MNLHEAYRLKCPEWSAESAVPLAAVDRGLLAGHSLSSDTLLHSVAVHEVTDAEATVLAEDPLGGVTGGFNLRRIAARLVPFLSLPKIQSATMSFQRNFHFREDVGAPISAPASARSGNSEPTAGSAQDGSRGTGWRQHSVCTCRHCLACRRAVALPAAQCMQPRQSWCQWSMLRCCVMC